MSIMQMTTFGGSLYNFTTATFTPGSAIGRFGPSLIQARAGLSGPEVNDWRNNTEFFNTSNGIQLWTVPQTGTFRIEAWGASGGGGNGSSIGGLGARVRGDFLLIEGTVIRILVGQAGTNIGGSISDGASGGGGGGSFVISGTSGTDDSQVLVIAAGGGGGNDQVFQSTRLDGTAGNGGTSGTGTANENGGSYRGSGSGRNGESFEQGGIGGTYTRSNQTSNGGFGGGGSQDDTRSGGGGWLGGTTGGTAAFSRNNGNNQSNSSGVRSGNGQVIITFIG